MEKKIKLIFLFGFILAAALILANNILMRKFRNDLFPEKTAVKKTIHGQAILPSDEPKQAVIDNPMQEEPKTGEQDNQIEADFSLPQGPLVN